LKCGVGELAAWGKKVLSDPPSPKDIRFYSNQVSRDIRALEPCAVAVAVFKNRKTAHQNRGSGFIFGIFYEAVQLRFWKCGCGFTAKTAVAYFTRVIA
jgi:hypothetical protein